MRLRRSGDTAAVKRYFSKVEALWFNHKSSSATAFKVVVGNDDNVYVRKQEWFLFTSKQSKIAFPKSSITNQYADICCHVDWYDFAEQHRDEIQMAGKDIRFLKQFGTVPYWVDGKIKPSSLTWAASNLFVCQQCPTEYQIHAGLVGQWTKGADNTYAIVITKWMCCGDGAIRLGGLWRRHCQTMLEMRLLQNSAFQAMDVEGRTQGILEEAHYIPVPPVNVEQVVEAWKQVGAQVTSRDAFH